MVILVVLALALLLLGFEMFLVLGVTSLAVKAIFFGTLPDIVIMQKVFGGINHATLLAIPFFILAAQLMGAGQIARNLINLAYALVGHTRGGMGHTAIAGSVAFGSVSGSAPATVAAMGAIVYPEMRKSGFGERFSLGLLVSSAESALLIPPSITLIVYGWMTGTSIAQLFAAGIAVGAVLALAFAIMVSIQARRDGIPAGSAPKWRERWMALRKAFWALGMPVIILGGIYSGIFTATEAAAVSVIYAMLVELIVYRELRPSDLVRITEEAAVSTSVVFVLLAMGSLISYFVTLAQVPGTISDFLTAVDAGPITFLIAVNVLFLVAGMFIDPNSALLILVPSLFPIAVGFGVDPVHFGMIVTLNICVGMITPPFGLDIFVAASTLRKPVISVVAGVWPFVVVNLLVLGIISYEPDISLFVPRLLY